MVGGRQILGSANGGRPPMEREELREWVAAAPTQEEQVGEWVGGGWECKQSVSESRGWDGVSLAQRCMFAVL